MKLHKRLIRSVKSFLRKACTTYFNRRLNSESLQMLFIIGHMRSGSSLLVHILNTNPEIIGYGETHYSYCEKSNFGDVAFKIYRVFKKIPFGEKYILDKILHSYLIKDFNLLEETKIIFLLRNPSEALPSIYELGMDGYTPAISFDYYIDRLEQVKAIARKHDPDNWIFITYEDLINATDQTFQDIENLLGLGKELTRHYSTIWSTGEAGIGDTSNYIYEGEIVKKKTSKSIPQKLQPFIKKAEKHFYNCLEELAGIKDNEG